MCYVVFNDEAFNYTDGWVYMVNGTYVLNIMMGFRLFDEEIDGSKVVFYEVPSTNDTDFIGSLGV